MPATGISFRCALVHMCARICAFGYICKVYVPEIPAHVPVRVSLWLGACVCVCVCMCIPVHRWFGARLRCLQCVSNGDAAVSRRAIDVCTHVCAYTTGHHPGHYLDLLCAFKPPAPVQSGPDIAQTGSTLICKQTQYWHRSRFGEPWVSAPSTPGNLSVF